MFVGPLTAFWTPGLFCVDLPLVQYPYGVYRITVTGMTCGHCGPFRTRGSRDIGGVKAVDPDLAGGEVSVDSDGLVDAGAIGNIVKGPASGWPARERRELAPMYTPTSSLCTPVG